MGDMTQKSCTGCALGAENIQEIGVAFVTNRGYVLLQNLKEK